MRPKGAQEHPEDAKISILEPTWLNLAPTWRPRPLPNPAQTQPKTLPDALVQQVWRFCRPFQHLHRFSFDFVSNLKA